MNLEQSQLWSRGLAVLFSTEMAVVTVPSAMLVIFLITVILTKHQQQMALLMNPHAQPNPDALTEGRVLKELAEVRDQLAQQSILIDELIQSQRMANRALDLTEDLAIRREI